MFSSHRLPKAKTQNYKRKTLYVNVKNVIYVINHVVFRVFFPFIDVIINGSFYSGFVYLLFLLQRLQAVGKNSDHCRVLMRWFLMGGSYL